MTEGSVGTEAFRSSLPYAGTSGHSGSDTSRERQERQDSDGTTGKNQRWALAVLDYHRQYGVTWQELARETGLHHGAASGALSNLHKDGRIARLTVRRERCKVYALPQYVGDRETEPHGGKPRGLTDVEQSVVDGARRSVDLVDQGVAKAVPAFRVRALLDIIERLS